MPFKNITQHPDFIPFIKAALAEDIGEGDHSSNASVPENSIKKARLLFKDEGVAAGIDIAKRILLELDPDAVFETYISDGDPIKKGDIGFIVNGKTRALLGSERLLLNLMQRLSGIATTAHKLAELIKPYPAKLLDTRKTTPHLRFLEKWAVTIGGGYNHRHGLYDMIMLKDNHVDSAGGIEAAIASTQNYLKTNGLNLKIEIETRNLDEVKRVVAFGGVDRIMLDNFTPKNIDEALTIINKQFETEASGGITEENIAAYARTGIDYISIGALTHSVKSLDISLKIF